MALPGDIQTLGPFQIIPPGLMDLLQLKQLGRLPGELEGSVKGVIELRDWLFTARRINIQNLAIFGKVTGANPVNQWQVTVATGSTGFHAVQQAGGPGINITVPGGQFWYIEQATASANLAAADILTNVCVATDTTLAVADIQQVGPMFSDVVTARARSILCGSTRGFWMFPGDTAGVYVGDVSSAAGITFNLYMRGTPFVV